jgi:lysophospholipase L1-like esterase
MKTWAFRILALLLGVVVALLAGEWIVRRVKPQNLSGRWRVYSERGYMMNRSGGRSRQQFGDRVVEYRFNELHLRGGPILPGGRRVLVLGDSFTFGFLLNEEDTFVRVLQRHADENFGPGTFQFLNGGAGGWGTADCLAFLEEFGERIAPEIVLAVFSVDDIGRSVESGLYCFTDDARREIAPAPARRPPSRLKSALNRLAFYDWLIEHSHFVQLARVSYLHASRGNAAQRQTVRESLSEDAGLRAGVALGQALFRRMNAWCRDHHARLLVTSNGSHMGKLVPNTRDPTMVFLKRAGGFFESEAIPFHDLTPGMEAATGGDWKPWSIPHDGHPNEDGARLIGDLIWDWLRTQLAPATDAVKAPGENSRQ